MRNGKSYSEAGLLGAIKSSKIKAEQKIFRIAQYDLKPVFCSNCSEPLPYEKRHNKFCSSSCSASSSNKGQARNPYGVNGKPRKEKKSKTKKPEKPVFYCELCHKQIRKNNTKYCSSQCHADYRWAKLLQEVKKNNGFASTDSYGRVKVMRKYLLQTRGHSCVCCGLKTWLDKPIPLTMDHVDGDSSNNSLPNLRLICCNCDALSPTYKGRNKGKGKGRAYRRQRYADGKSY